MSYSISDAALKIGLEAHTLRYYEKEGIISPGRSENGNRFYTESDMDRLSFISCLKRTGMTVSEIRSYFALAEEGDCTLERRLEMFWERRRHVISEIAELNSHLETVEHKIKYYECLLSDRENS